MLIEHVAIRMTYPMGLFSLEQAHPGAVGLFARSSMKALIMKTTSKSLLGAVIGLAISRPRTHETWLEQAFLSLLWLTGSP